MTGLHNSNPAASEELPAVANNWKLRISSKTLFHYASLSSLAKTVSVLGHQLILGKGSLFSLVNSGCQVLVLVLLFVLLPETCLEAR